MAGRIPSPAAAFSLNHRPSIHGAAAAGLLRISQSYPTLNEQSKRGRFA